MWAASVVRVAEEDGIVEIKNEPTRSTAKQVQLPGGQELALKQHGVELAGAVDLSDATEHGSLDPLDGERPAEVGECRGERAKPVSSTDVVRCFGNPECPHPVLLDGLNGVGLLTAILPSYRRIVLAFLKR
jgi:hypothetical protein